MNEDNIDLNRNFLSDADFEFVRSRDPNYSRYVDLDPFLNRVVQPFGDYHTLNKMHAMLQAALVLISNGLDMSIIKRAMVAGNYHKANGYGFGGGCVYIKFDAA